MRGLPPRIPAVFQFTYCRGVPVICKIRYFGVVFGIVSAKALLAPHKCGGSHHGFPQFSSSPTAGVFRLFVKFDILGSFLASSALKRSLPRMNAGAPTTDLDQPRLRPGKAHSGSP